MRGTLDSPLIRWAGGKRVLIHKLVRYVPKEFGTYYEPMVGGGALFFALKPPQAVLSDVNKDLMNFYAVVNRHPRALYSLISRLRAYRRNYYKVREWSPADPLSQAVRFFYLVRLSWNGLYRVNKAGHFNVPFGGRKPKELISWNRLHCASQSLQAAQLRSGDFEDTVRMAKRNDFVYLDPPYPKGASDGNGFSRYSATGFTTEDHERLAVCAQRLAKRGVFVLLTEAAQKDILRLYPANFHIRLLRTRSLIAAQSDYRGEVREAIITSYHPQMEG